MESELVSGFMTEHSSVPFIFFFLGEYSSIVLFSCITSILFLGGYNLPEIFFNNTIAEYSPRKKNIKGTELCSVIKPETSSDSENYKNISLLKIIFTLLIFLFFINFTYKVFI